MKICAIICEYNPFHNGHHYQLQEAKRLSGADALLCIMSGNFVQRGEAAILEKFTRAKHAVLAGADAVIELPAVFATSNAELFAKGAITILNSIPDITTLCFGAENADRDYFLHAANLLNNEPAYISAKIKELTDAGMSYAKARTLAWSDQIPEAFISSPNNILGLEYTRAILALNSKINIMPITRIGGGYNETALKDNYSSATAIRTAISEKKAYSHNVPDFVAEDLPCTVEKSLDVLEKYAILANTATKIKHVCDCTEGLENAFKKAAEETLPLVDALTSPRYISSRIRRIALQNLLNIDKKLIHDCLQSPLYLRILGIKKARKDLLSALSISRFPIIARPRDEAILDGIAKECMAVDIFAEKVYGLLYKREKHVDIFIE